MPREPGEPHEPLGLLLLSGGYERAHYALMIATAAAAMGREVVLFATNGGCHVLARDWSGLRGDGVPAAEQDGAVRARGVAGLDELREAIGELEVRLLVCDAGLRLTGLRPADLLPGVEVAGIPTLLARVGTPVVI